MFPALLLATRTYTLPPDKLAKAIAYASARNWLHFIGAAYGILVLAGVLAWHLGPRLRNLVESVSRRRLVQAYIFVPLLLLIIDVLELPVSLFGHHLSLEFEQSIQGWGSWFWDWTKGELLSFALAGVLVWILYGVIRRSPRRWWFYVWLAAIPIVVFLAFIEPVVVEPLFFKFGLLAAKQPALVAEISKVVAHGGLEIPADRMYEMNASEKLKSLNAYVTGIGASKRVVVWDNTIQKMNNAQILSVFGHEMGHYVLGHVWIGMAGACVGILVFLFLAYHILRVALPAAAIAEWSSLPAILLILSVLGFVGEPVAGYFSRILEHNADVYGLEVIHGIVPNSAEEAANAFQILGEVSLDDPHPSPFIEFWLYDHPSISERVRFSSDYDPWSPGRQPKYVK